MNIANFLKRLGKDNSGATAIEYGLIVSLVVISIVGALNSVASETSDMWTDVSREVREVVSG